MDAHKAKISELEAKIAELKAGKDADGADQLAIAREIIAARAELTAARTELAEIAEAFADEEVAEVEADVEDSADVEDDAEVIAEDAVPATLAASAGDGEDSPTATPSVPTIALTASGSMGGVNGGTTLDRESLRRVLAGTLQAGHGAGSGRILEINRWDDSAIDAPSEANSAIQNTRLIREAQRKHAAGERNGALALTAGACFCGPDQVLEDLGLTGDRGRPVAGVFPSIPVNGGFSFFRDLTINPDSGSVGVWTCTDQDAVDPDDPLTWKPCPELDCFTQISSYPYMVKACTTVQRTHKWAHPEQVDTWIEKLRLEYDRVAEKKLLSIIEADAVNTLTVGTVSMAAHGLLAQTLYALGSLSFSLGYQFRSSAIEGHVVIVPKGFYDSLLTDELLRGFPSGIKTKGEITSLIQNAYGVRLVERLDEPTGALSTAAAATVTALNAGGPIDAVPNPLQPGTFRMHIVRPDQWVHGEGTFVGADWFVDNEMILQNKLQYFWENVETLVRTGVEKAYVVDVDCCINGSYTDLVVGPDCS